MTSFYSSALTRNSTTYTRQGTFTPGFYYHAIQVKTNTAGNYSLYSVSEMDTYGYLYENNFDPLSPYLHVLEYDDDSAGRQQFSLEHFLKVNFTYILLVTTNSAHTTGSFTIVGSGPDTLQFTT